MARSIVVYTRPTCLFCEQVRELLRDSGMPHREVMVTDAVEQMQLMEKCDARSFPVVFVDDVYMGGFTHIIHLHSQNRLHELLGEDGLPPLPISDRPMRSSSSPAAAADSALGMVSAFAAWGEYKRRRR